MTDRTTRDAYDAVAQDYARLLPDVSIEAPLDRAVLAAFVEMAQPGGPVLEVGCGTGRVTAHLAGEGLGVVGVDLSTGMLSAARKAHPDVALAVADAGALPVRSGSVGGLVAWYSVIHTAPDLLPGVLAELARVVRPGAPVVVAFQCGDDERVDREAAYGHPVPLTSYRHRVEAVTAALAAAGLALHATVRREPALAHETTAQAFVLATRG